MKKFIIASIVLMASMTACTDKFEDFNTDTKNPAEVSGNSLFTNAQKSLTDQISSTNVNQNIFKLWAQYWTETTYTDEANFDLITRNIPDNVFRFYYRRPLRDLQEAAKLIAVEELVPETNTQVMINNRLAIIEVLNVYAFSQLVDIFGMIPYTDALDIENVYPAYDNGADVYADLFVRLDAAIANMDDKEGSFGAADLIYEGDVASWEIFAQALKLKMAITLADVNPTLARTHAEAAAAAIVGQNLEAYFPYQSASPNQNPLYEDMIKSGRNDFVPANTLVDMLTNLKDPRIAYFIDDPVAFVYDKNDKNTKIDSTLTGDGIVCVVYQTLAGKDSIVFAELPYTIQAEDSLKKPSIHYGGSYGYSSSYAQYSHVHENITEPDFNGILLTNSEVMFYLAEAAERGFSVGGTATEFYEDGIRASIAEWGGTVAEADAYLAQPSVDYETAAGDWKQKIATQAWLAAYTRGLEGYNIWRRLDYPTFNLPEFFADGTVDDIPVRFTFPVNEQTLNADQYDAAAEAIGGDVTSTHVFWDIY